LLANAKMAPAGAARAPCDPFAPTQGETKRLWVNGASVRSPRVERSSESPRTAFLGDQHEPILRAPMLIIFGFNQAGAQSPHDESFKRGYFGVQLMAGAIVGNTEPDGAAQAAGVEPGSASTART
jgi:hypothetical protein